MRHLTRFPNTRSFRATLAFAGVVALLLSSSFQPAAAASKSDRLAKKRARAMERGRIAGPEGVRHCNRSSGICEDRYSWGEAAEAYNCNTSYQTNVDWDGMRYRDEKAKDLREESKQLRKEAEDLRRYDFGKDSFEKKLKDYNQASSKEEQAKKKDKEADYQDSYWTPPIVTPTTTCSYRRFTAEFVHQDGQHLLRLKQDWDSNNVFLDFEQGCYLEFQIGAVSVGSSCTVDEKARTIEAPVPAGAIARVPYEQRTLEVTVEIGLEHRTIHARRSGPRIRYGLGDFVASH